MSQVILLSLLTLLVAVGRASKIIERDSSITCPTNQPFNITAETLNVKNFANIRNGHFGGGGAVYFFGPHGVHADAFEFQQNEGGCQLVLPGNPANRALVIDKPGNFSDVHVIHIQDQTSGIDQRQDLERTDVYCHTNAHQRLFCSVKEEGFEAQHILGLYGDYMALATSQSDLTAQDFYIEFNAPV